MIFLLRADLVGETATCDQPLPGYTTYGIRTRIAEHLCVQGGTSSPCKPEEADYGWCPECGCGNSRVGYAHLPKCSKKNPS